MATARRVITVTGRFGIRAVLGETPVRLVAPSVRMKRFMLEIRQDIGCSPGAQSCRVASHDDQPKLAAVSRETLIN